MSLLPRYLPTFVPDDRFTIEAYLAIEEATGKRYEYHDGELVSVEAMAGGSFVHAVLGINIGHALLTAFETDEERYGRCSAASSDLRIAIEGGTRYLYADAAVVCGEPIYDEIIPTAIVNPVAVFEVLSPSSDQYDRGLKFEFYGALSTLREYVLVDQERRRVEVRHRTDQTSPWRYSTYTESDKVVSLPSLGIELPFKRLYRGWKPNPPTSPRPPAPAA